ncbi:MAG: adenine-specific methyltransferase EcoRI family protein [Paludibacteraceae bacterium]|nr:adenine-specific methyltransferase EcoRI family protein [Paludibacteraceae bacterium]
MASKNMNLAKVVKNDEFYTLLDDIAKELKYYKPYFKNKVVFCNCDDPYESNFFKYFALNFNALGLKKLIATCYNGSPIAGDELPLLFDISEEEPKKIAYNVEISEVKDYNNDGAVNLADVQYLIQNDKNVLSLLKGNGDFRSQECIELLKQADIVVTNPPFSLFREYVAQLIHYKKKFLIIGNQNALSYKEIFHLIRQNILWTGYNMVKTFMQPHTTELKKFGNVCWFTNMDIVKRHEEIDLYKHYTPEEYPHFENFDAINVNSTAEIPCDYEGAMGVPITFIDKYSPDQFEIIGLGISNSGLECGVRPYKPEHKKYRKEVQKRGAVDGDLYMMIDGVVTVPYARILIRRKR